MWLATVAEIKAHDTESVSLFASSLNDLIDMDGKRQAAARNHVPPTVWLLLMVVTVTACGTTGYGDSGRHALSMLLLPVLLTIVITIIADLDNPHRGLIQASQQLMVDLHARGHGKFRVGQSVGPFVGAGAAASPALLAETAAIGRHLWFHGSLHCDRGRRTVDPIQRPGG